MRKTMADQTAITITSRCYSCLSRNDEKQLQIYHIQGPALKTIFQAKQLILCYICKKLASNAERFVHNVEIVQNLLKGFGSVTDNDNIRSIMKLTLDLTVSLLNEDNVIHMSGLNPEDIDNIKIEYDNEHTSDFPDMGTENIKEEEDKNLIEGVANFETFISSLENEYDVKEETDLLKLPKKEIKLKGSQVKHKYIKPSRIKNKVKAKKEIEILNVSELKLQAEIDAKIETLSLSHEQVLEERAEKRLEKLYLSCEFKCVDCIKGFSYKPSFDKHMEKHSKKSGSYECDICKLRVVTEEKLNIHKRYHTVRHRCTVCKLTRVCRMTIEDHIWTTHGAGLHCKCRKCNKTFKCKSALRKHLYYGHKEKIPCGFCNKYYVTKESLKAHLRRRHPTEVSGTKPAKRHACKDCGMAFESPSSLKSHGAKHSLRRDYYCVECDKSFKTNTSLQQHLKTVSVHVTPEDLKFPCTVCEKRFTTKSHADRHLNDVHLKSSRFYCDQCGKEYRCKYKLASHIRAHEGFEKPRRFFCSICNKGFHSKRNLDVHIRVHTGEKPFLCPACPAQFNQYGSLYNHKKLVHKIVGKASKEININDVKNLGKNSKIENVKFTRESD